MVSKGLMGRKCCQNSITHFEYLKIIDNFYNIEGHLIFHVISESAIYGIMRFDSKSILWHFFYSKLFEYLVKINISK